MRGTLVDDVITVFLWVRDAIYCGVSWDIDFVGIAVTLLIFVDLFAISCQFYVLVLYFEPYSSWP